MYSRNIISVLYLAAIVLFATLAQVVSAAPSGQNLTPGQVVTMNRINISRGCRMRDCYNVVVPNTTDTSTSDAAPPENDATSVASATIPEATDSVDAVPEDNSVPESSSSSSNGVVHSDTQVNAAHREHITVILPVAIAALSLLSLL